MKASRKAASPEPTELATPRTPCASPRWLAGVSSTAITTAAASAPSWNIRAAPCHATSAASVVAVAVAAPSNE